MMAPLLALASSYVGLARVAEGLSIVGGGVRAVAAGIAEAESVLVLGFVVATIVSILSAVLVREQSCKPLSRPAIVVMWAGFAILLGGHSALVVSLARRDARYAPETATIALFGAAVTGACLLVALLAAFWRVERSGVMPRANFAWHALTFGVLGAVFWSVVEHFRHIALG